MDMTLSRRQFLATTGAGLLALSLDRLALGQVGAAGAAGAGMAAAGLPPIPDY